MGRTRSCQTLQARGPVSSTSCQQQHQSTGHSAAGRRLYQAERFTKVLTSGSDRSAQAGGSSMAAAKPQGLGVVTNHLPIP